MGEGGGEEVIGIFWERGGGGVSIAVWFGKDTEFKVPEEEQGK